MFLNGCKIFNGDAPGLEKVINTWLIYTAPKYYLFTVDNFAHTANIVMITNPLKPQQVEQRIITTITVFFKYKSLDIPKAAELTETTEP